MKFKEFNYLVLSFTVFFGCELKKNDVKSESQPNYIKTLEKSSKKIRLEIDEETPNISPHFSYYDPDSIWFFNLNQINNEIQMFNLNTQTLHARVKFEQEGNNGVGRIFGFHIHNLDSIFLFPPSVGQIILTDTSKVIKSKITYKVPDGLTSAFVLSSSYYSPPTVINNKLIVKSLVQAEYRTITDKQLSSNSLAYSIDLQTGNVKVLPHFYPKGYLPNGPRHFEHSIAVTDSKIVYSFFADHNLYYADLEGSALEKKNAPSSYLKGEFEDFPLDGRRMDSYKYLFSSPHYESLMYDKYRNVFYRFCYPKVELDDESEIIKSRIYRKLFSIMILDSELNIIGETKFEDEKFFSNNAFVAREGIYISINHTDNPKNEEDYLQFQLFELNDVTDGE
jgi:hypothetical protein